MNENQNISRNYYELGGSLQSDEFARDNEMLRKSIVPALAKRMKGKTLMVGWSPTLMFTPPAAEIFVVADFALNALKKTPLRSNVCVVCAGADRLPFDRGAFDTVLTVGLLHHLTRDNVVETDGMTHAVLRDIARIMHRDSKLYVVEPLVSPFIEVINRIVFFIARLYLNWKGLPMMCLLSLQNLRVMLDNEGLELKYATPIGMTGHIPVSWFAPKFKIEYRFLPQKIHLLEIHKKKQM
jgi:hypothetical protein